MFQQNKCLNHEIFYCNYDFIGCNLGCFNIDCKASVKNRNTNKSSITVREIKTRSIEGLRRNGFLVSPVYKCNECNKTKYATDIEALAVMGVPLFILKRCEFVFFHKSTWTLELMEFVNSWMIGQIINVNFYI
jgi:hypothetical protein